MEAEAHSAHSDPLAPHPLVELLQCPPAVSAMLNRAAQSLDFDAGEFVFRQGAKCRGLYLVVTGLFQRKAERIETRLTLGPVRPGDLVELSAALCDGRHTCSLFSVASGTVLELPLDALNRAFQEHPPLRMRLLEELAREVSRAYAATCRIRISVTRQRAPRPE
jgi:CRP-like cAMP-binding protein